MRVRRPIEVAEEAVEEVVEEVEEEVVMLEEVMAN